MWCDLGHLIFFDVCLVFFSLSDDECVCVCVCVSVCLYCVCVWALFCIRGCVLYTVRIEKVGVALVGVHRDLAQKKISMHSILARSELRFGQKL